MEAAVDEKNHGPQEPAGPDAALIGQWIAPVRKLPLAPLLTPSR